MLRCGLRVGEVSGLPWSAIDLAQGTVRIDNSKGHVDRVVYLAPDVAKALRQWPAALRHGSALCLSQPAHPQGWGCPSAPDKSATG